MTVEQERSASIVVAALGRARVHRYRRPGSTRHDSLATHHRPPPCADPVSTPARRRWHFAGHRLGVSAARCERADVFADTHLRARSLVILDDSSDRLANVFVIFVYAPILLCLPVLLVGLMLVCIPGGFIIVLGGLYYAFVWFTGLLGLAAIRRRWSGGPRVRPNPSSENASRSGRPSLGSRRARPTAFGLTTDPAVASAPNLELSRRVSNDINLLAARERGYVPDRQDGAQAT